MTTYLKNLIRDYPDFPKKGIIFKDILPILQRPEDFSELIKKMSKNQMCLEAEAIISIDARGFIFGTALSFLTSKPMIVARKPGKLPGDLISKSYLLEYGENSLSIQKESLKKYNSYLIVDDLLATGGTVLCVAEIIKEQKKEVTGLSVVVELAGLNARKKLTFPVDSQLTL